jgi:hypothetical protein
MVVEQTQSIGSATRRAGHVLADGPTYGGGLYRKKSAT